MTEQRERTERIQGEQQERRRRNDTTLDGSRAKNLFIPEEVKARLAAEGKTPRWVNDVSGRIRHLTVNDDYDKVEGVEPVPVVINKKTGETVKAHLLAKRTDFIAEDRDRADQRRRDVEQGMMRGRVPTSPGGESAPVQGVAGAEAYALSSNKIGRENQIIE